VSGGVESYELPGDHIGIFREPHVQYLADQLNQGLRNAQQPVPARHQMPDALVMSS